MRLTTREQITPSVQPRPHSQTSLLRILSMPNRRCKFATIYCARSLEIPFLPRAHRHDLGADCPYYCGQKMSHAADRRPRARLRAWLLLPAESLYVTEVKNLLSIFLNGRSPCRTAD